MVKVLSTCYSAAYLSTTALYRLILEQQLIGIS